MRGCLQCYMWGWMDGMVVIDHLASKSTFGAKKGCCRLNPYIRELQVCSNIFPIHCFQLWPPMAKIFPRIPSTSLNLFCNSQDPSIAGLAWGNIYFALKGQVHSYKHTWRGITVMQLSFVCILRRCWLVGGCQGARSTDREYFVF